MKESGFQHNLILKLYSLFPGCMVIKTDPLYLQGIPDLLILYGNKWAALECKVRYRANRQPNQAYYVDKMDQMSFASFISPENETEVLYGLQEALR